MNVHFNYSILILPILVIGFILLVIFKKLYFNSSKTIKDSSMSTSNKTTRIAESIILLCIGLVIFIFMATNTSTGGRLLNLDQYQKGFAITNVIVAAVIFVGVLIAIGFVYFKKTSLGVIIIAVVLSCYGLILNGPEQILESMAPEGSIIPDSTLTFYLSSPDIQGGELWVNGVHLGTLPYETTFDEFYEAVPFWPEEPNENKSEDFKLLIPRWNPYSDRPSGSLKKPWARITIPEEPVSWNERKVGAANLIDWNSRTYYARVKLGDEWGYSNGHGGNSGGSGGRYDKRNATVTFQVIFPERQKRIEKLLDIARLYDYSPETDWFETMETYGSDGWMVVQKVMDEEPEMSKLLDAWTSWKYDLDKVTDSKSAWNTFLRIYNEAEMCQKYFTSDIAGRAVELLVPKLDQQKLIYNVKRIILSTNRYIWYQWEINERLQFGINNASNIAYTGANQITSVARGDGGKKLSPGDFVFAHAIWMLDKLLDEQNDTKPNIVESELVPLFIAQNYNDINLIQIAASIGGTSVEKYLLRQNWSIEPQKLPYSQQKHIGVDRVNGWLFLLANLKTETGNKFRRENTRNIMDMADSVADRMNMSWLDDLDFIFIDKYLGEESFAYKYWPRFKEIVSVKKIWDALELQYQYLFRMEPLSTVDMYVQCWKSHSSDYSDFESAIDCFSDAEIAPDKRQKIYSALAEQVDSTISNITDEITESNKRNILQYLRSELLREEPNEYAQRIYQSLKTSGTQYKPENVASWLANEEQTHPLIKMLIESDKPQLRLLVMGALKEHPIPSNMAILKKFLNDSGEEVHNAAEHVMLELEQLKETEPAKFAAK